MEKQRAIEVLEEWLAVDKAAVGDEPVSDFDKFIREKDDALEVALAALKREVEAESEN